MHNTKNLAKIRSGKNLLFGDTMARRKKRKILGFIPRLDIDPAAKRGIFIVTVCALGFIALLGLFGKSGLLGEYLLDFMTWAFGWGRWLLPFIFIAWAYMLYDDERFELRGSTYFGFILFFSALHLFFSLMINRDIWDLAMLDGRGGGQLGYFLAGLFITVMGFFASLISALGLMLISMVIIFDTSLREIIGRDSFLGKIFYPFHFVMDKIFARFEKKDEEEQGEGEEPEEGGEEEEEQQEEENEEDEEESEESEEEAEDEGDEEEKDKNEDEESEEENEEEEEEETPLPVRRPPPVEKLWWQEKTELEVNIPLRLLNATKGKPTSGDIENNKELIRKTLEDFGIQVEMKGVSIGPTVTQYSFRPADGVKVAKITNLSNDLALSLAAESVRIEAPIPGKSLVGIEVPNESKAMVGLRELFSSEAFKERKHDMFMALGKDVAGKPRLADLTSMPHLLVAGTTGAGKSVCLNTLIISLMYQNNPDDLRMIMVDPKQVELTAYDKTPYLLTPVITDVKKTVNSLKWCINEMEKRYEVLRESGNKNIQTYNQSHEVHMPYIVLIIDELADLMVSAGKEIETSVIRLAQKSRAVGIHLILATQRPSVNVITGLIKANMPSRIAFKVASSTDSRTILDGVGAEKLIGRGDMLFLNPEMPKPVRLQGAFLSEEEINRLAAFVKSKSKKLRYLDEVTDGKKVVSAGGGGQGIAIENADELLLEARDIVVSTGKASTTFLQRRMRIGYSRAASILDQLEELGIIGPGKGAKPRDILVSKQQLFAMDSQPMSGMSIHDRDEAEAPDSYLSDEEEAETPPVFRKKKEEDIFEEEEEENDEEEGEEPEEGEEAEENDDSEEEVFDEDEEAEEEEEEEKPKRKSNKSEEDEAFFAR